VERRGLKRGGKMAGLPGERKRRIGPWRFISMCGPTRSSIIEHLAEHDLTPDDFEYVLANPMDKGTSDSSGRPAAWGYTEDGRFIIAIYLPLDDVTIQPVTAYEVPEELPKKKKRKK
jgi:hypothetical protein